MSDDGGLAGKVCSILNCFADTYQTIAHTADQRRMIDAQAYHIVNLLVGEASRHKQDYIRYYIMQKTRR